jgi:hypothetical protein
LLSVTIVASERGLLSLTELRAATGVTDGSKDAALMALGATVASTLARICRIPTDGVTPPTFRLETLAETIELEFHQEKLILSRRPIVSVASVVENGVTLLADEYRIEAGAGLLQRRISGYRSHWPASVDIVVSYDAGWATVPDDLKLAATKTANLFWSESGPTPRDPNLKRERIEGVSEFEYWVPPASDPLLSAEISELLTPYMNYGM